jgi:IS30 family transposase
MRHNGGHSRVLRQYFPGADIAALTPKELDTAANSLNTSTSTSPRLDDTIKNTRPIRCNTP